MIEDKIFNRDYNEKVKPNTAFENELRNKLPEFFNKNGFDLEKFKAALKDKNVTEFSEGYQLDFIGKDYARKQAGDASTSVIVPDNDNNQQPENKNSKNLFFTGDNLEVLRHLRNAYSNKINVIYIDPPYNTGNDDFVYPDKFDYSKKQLEEIFGMSEKDVNKLNNLKNSKSHSAWLTFMYPRLWLAKQLLTDDGLIFISIDDNEQANLKLLMDSIFGENNFIANIMQKHRTGISNDKLISVNHNFLLFYGKNITKLGEEKQKFGFLRTKDDFKGYTKDDNDGKGKYKLNPVTGPGGASKGNPYYEFLGIKNYWRFSKDRMKKMFDDNRIVKTTNNLYQKTYLSEIKNKKKGATTWWDNVGTTSEGTKEIKQLFKETVFKSPKPTSLIKQIMNYISMKNGIILDFFAGSSTTADAVMQLNAEDGGHRQFIMVQLPEKTYEIDKNGNKKSTKGGKVAFEAGYMSIDEISRERIRRAAQKIKKEHPDLHDFDSGFKHYRVVKPVKKLLDEIEYYKDANKINLFTDMVNSFSSKSLAVDGNAMGEDTLLTTWLIHDGYAFDADVQEVKFGHYLAYKVEDNRLYLINEGWDTDQTKELLNQLGTYQMNVQSVVIFKYSFNDTSKLRELETGLKQLDSNVTLIKRF